MVEAPFGAHPTSANPEYHLDLKHLKTYVDSAASPEAWAEYRKMFVDVGDAEYLAAAGGARRCARCPARFIEESDIMTEATLADLVILACAQAWRHDGEVMAHGIGPLPRLGTALAKTLYNPALQTTDGECYYGNRTGRAGQT